MIDRVFYAELINYLNVHATELVAVSKTQTEAAIMELYALGQRVFGENKVQELLQKQENLPKDIQWHLIGTLQSNKVKQIIPHVQLIHSVSSLKLLNEIEKQSQNLGIETNVLLQIHIAQEETKFGFSYNEIKEIFQQGIPQQLKNTHICGFMGMASFTSDKEVVKNEFSTLKAFYEKLKTFKENQESFKYLSMGMSGDYKLAIECGSNMVRIGSSLFGARNYTAI